MSIFLSLSFFLFFVLFLLAVFFSFYIPGSIAVSGFSLKNFEHIVLSIIVGMSLWAWQGFVFGFLHLRLLSYFYLILFFFLWIKKDDWKRFQKMFQKIKLQSLDLPLIFIVALGTILETLSIFFIGIVHKDNISFCCGIPDALYHLALTNQLIKQFPPTEPAMSQVLVHNYHYLSNLVIADLIRVFNLPLLATSYQYFTILFSLLFGLSAILFARVLNMKKVYIYWLMLFLYFSGDLTYLLSFLAGKGLNFDQPFLENALWLWISPPRVFAVVVFFSGISLLTLWLKNKKVYTGVLTAVVLSSLIGFKVYFGIFALSGLSVLLMLYIVKREFRMVSPILLAISLSLILYLYVNTSAGGLIFTGFWRFEDFISLPLLGLSHFELAREIYASHHNWFGVLRYEALFVLIFFIFVFGTIIIGFFQTRKSLELIPHELNLFFISAITVSLILGSFFIQTSGGANSSQFLINADIVCAIYAALACYFWTEKLKGIIKTAIILCIVLLTIPRVLYIGYHQKIYPFHSSLTIDKQELQALGYLKKDTPNGSIIIVDNLEEQYDDSDLRHWKNSDSYYISFLGNRPLFIDGSRQSIVRDHGVDTKKRIAIAKTIFSSNDSKLIRNLLYQSSIRYIYLATNSQKEKNLSALFEPAFQNKEITILNAARKW